MTKLQMASLRFLKTFGFREVLQGDALKAELPSDLSLVVRHANSDNVKVQLDNVKKTAADRVLLIGDAAGLSSPLTFCGFGSHVRNLRKLTELTEFSLVENDFEVRCDGKWCAEFCLSTLCRQDHG